MSRVEGWHIEYQRGREFGLRVVERLVASGCAVRGVDEGGLAAAHLELLAGKFGERAAWLGSAGLVCHEIDKNHYRFHCSDGPGEVKFDALIFDVVLG